MAEALAAKACDYAMPDFARIGGVSGWLESAALAREAGMPMSSHLYPEFSAHLLAVTPTCDWLEYVDWASPVLEEPIEVRDGHCQHPSGCDVPAEGCQIDHIIPAEAGGPTSQDNGRCYCRVHNRTRTKNPRRKRPPPDR